MNTDLLASQAYYEDQELLSKNFNCTNSHSRLEVLFGNKVLLGNSHISKFI
jgi:hypothetical protein